MEPRDHRLRRTIARFYQRNFDRSAFLPPAARFSPSPGRRNFFDPKVHLKSAYFRGPGSTSVIWAALGWGAINEGTVRFHAQSALLFLLLRLTFNPFAVAQGNPGRPDGTYRATREDPERMQRPIGPRLLTLNDGLAILGAALDSRHHADFPSDCSHFVHGLYQRAGFAYEYASSSELYAGINEFRRVASPQPGDLAVWQGHAGIVVNPVQHSFFSLLRSGPGVDWYDSPYWKQRGRPRFFRYVKAVSGSGLSNSIRPVSLKPAAGKTEPNEPVAKGPAPDMSEESTREAGNSPTLGENQPVNALPLRVSVVNSVRPNPDQVSAAFLQACADSEESLRGRDLFKSAQSLIVFNHIVVTRVQHKGSQHWAEIQIDELASLAGTKADVHKRSERQRWSLNRRDNTSWELTPLRDTIYLPLPVAVRVLAHELAQLTEDSPDPASRTQEKAELARVLNALLEK